ncbi:MAG: CHAD domain-containing protein [Planctomycetes bacterium]|nr:CHAD domain-containing protein [Planctomycetota bacterium]
MPPNPANQRADVYLRNSIKRLSKHLDAAIAELPGAPGVHAVRVSARRLRSVLRQFEDHLPPGMRRTQERLRDLAAGFSALRDLDVLLGNLERWSKKLEAETLAPLVARLVGRRESLVTKAGKALKQWQTSGGREELEHLTRPGNWPEAAQVTMGEIAPEIVHRAYEGFARAVRRARRKATLKRYHKLRIRGKRLRYVLTALPGLFDSQATPVLKGLVAVQDAFGEYLDANNAAQVLGGEKRRRGLKPETRGAIDKLIERCNRHSDKHLKKMPGLLERLDPQQWEGFMASVRGGSV